MTVMYKVSGTTFIQKVEVLSETEKMLEVRGYDGRVRRETKKCQWHEYFSTFAKAKQVALLNAKAYRLRLEEMLKDLNAEVMALEARVDM